MLKSRIAIGASSLSLGLIYLYKKGFREDKEDKDDKKDKLLNKYTYKDVKQHIDKDKGIWVSYKENIYDITDYIEYHPGGKDKILLAAGGPLENYWNLYQQHLDKDYIFKDILDKRKIGVLSDYKDNHQHNDPYLNEPIRDNQLIYHQVKPCNAEIPHDLIMDEWITPNNLWYIRNHHPVPIFNNKSSNYYRLFINKQDFSIDQLKKIHPPKTVVSTMQCGGNRRSELNKIGKTSGTPWSYGAISNAAWTGVPLNILLKNVYTKKEIEKNKYINCTSYDGVKISIPLDKVMDENGDVILAYQMNKEDIPPDHGYPLRLIVPGFVGVRNLKWIKSISLSEKEIEGPWQTGLSYKALPSYLNNLKDIDYSNYLSINNLPVQSVIVNVEKQNNLVKTSGFAWSGGGKKIIRVDVSPDGGKTWNMARLTKGSDQQDGKAWAWTFWELEFKSDLVNKIICKATDTSLSTQPEKLEQVWNIRGLCNNSWFQYENEINPSELTAFIFGDI